MPDTETYTSTPECRTVAIEIPHATAEEAAALLGVLADLGLAKELAETVKGEQQFDHHTSPTKLALGACAQCALEDLCPVNEKLKESDIESRYEAAPSWLQAVIRRRALDELNTAVGYNYRDIHTIDETVAEIALRLVENKLSFQEDVLGGASEEQMPAVFKDDIPQLMGNRHYDAGIECPVTRITTANGVVVEVVDASTCIKEKDAGAVATADSRDLCEKLFANIVSVDDKGKPQILTPDGSVTKSIKSIKYAQCYEIRKGGSKNRLYIIVDQYSGTKDAPHRILIMGGHGGTDKTQNRFVDTVLNDRS